jgi:hypothetical protein
MKGWVTGKRGQKWLLVDNEMPQWLVLSYGDGYSLHYIICIIPYQLTPLISLWGLCQYFL